MTLLKLLLAGAAAAPVVLWFLAVEKLRWLVRARKSPQGREIIFSYSQVLWDDVWQRPQEYAWRTAGERGLIYCAPVQLHNWLRTLRGRWRPVIVDRSGGRDLIVLSPLVFSGHFKSRWIFELNCRIVAAHTAPWLRRAHSIDCVTNTPYGMPVIKRLFGAGASRDSRLRNLAYDVIDDFTTFDWSPVFGGELDNRLMREADVVFTGTHELLTQRSAARPEARFIACGVDFESFNHPAPQPGDLKDLPRPIIGYFGTISDRLDLDLLDKVARAFPDGTLAVIGPVHLPESVLPRGVGNVRFLGLKPHDVLPAYAQAFDVGLIPFRITEATLKLNPVKTLEYLAAGLPVVSTAIPDVKRFFSEAVLVAGDHDEFVTMVRQAVASPDAIRREAGIAMARNASWQEMARCMNELIVRSPEDKYAAEPVAGKERPDAYRH